MALTTDQATLNTAVDVFMNAWQTYMATLSGGELVAIVPVERMKGDAADTRFGVDTTTVFNGNGVRHYIKATQDVSATADIPLAAGRMPLFWKITNSAGDLA